MWVPANDELDGDAQLMMSLYGRDEGECRVSAPEADFQPTRLGALLVTRPPRGEPAASGSCPAEDPQGGEGVVVFARQPGGDFGR